MTRQELEPWQLRTARFEVVEERLVLSADPLPALVLHGELMNAVQDELVSYEHHTLDLENASALAPQLGSVNNTTGVNYVHNNYGFNGAGQTVAVIDSGIAWDHYNLGRGYGANYRVVGGWDFAENDANPYDDAPAGFHGTHVAGIIGSDHATYSGVAPGADLVALRVFNDAGQGNFAWVESALQWVIAHHDDFENPITTVNMSLGVPEMNGTSVPNWATLENELQTLNAMGIFVAVSAGNDFAQFSAQGLSYPAVSQWVVPVASANDAGTALSSFSQRDDRVLVAPGETITSTVPDALFSFNGVPNDWASASGTSMASPYVAGASVLVREAFWSIGVTNVDQDMIYDVLFDTADLIYDPITAASYHFIDVQAAVASILSQAAEETPAPPPTDLGVVDAQHLTQVSIAGETWYRVTAANSGYFTVRAMSPGQQNVDVLIYNQSQQQLVDGGNRAGFARADVLVQAGQTLYVQVVGDSPHTDVTFSNLVQRVGNSVVVRGAAGNDAFAFTAGAQHIVVAGGIGYSFDASAVANFTFNGGGGDNSLRFTGTSGNETANIYVGTGSIVGSGFQVSAGQTQRFVLAGNGGSDVARLWGSAGNDVLTTSPDEVRFSGAGFSRVLTGFNDVTVYGGAGFDQATMRDSAGDDLFWTSPERTLMRGPGYSRVATGFERAYGEASLGNDRVVFHGSAANDVFTAGQNHGEMIGPGYHMLGRNFDQIVAWANGGNDRASVYDAALPNQLRNQPGLVTLYGSTFNIYAANFAQATIHAQPVQTPLNSFAASPAESIPPGAYFAAIDAMRETPLARGQTDSLLRDVARTRCFAALDVPPSSLAAGAHEAGAQSTSHVYAGGRSSSFADEIFGRHSKGWELAERQHALATADTAGIESEFAPHAGLSSFTPAAGAADPLAELFALDFFYFTLSEAL